MLNAKKVIDEFNLKIINKKKYDVNREINGTTIHRFGLELSGWIDNSQNTHSIVGWGTKEKNFLNTLKNKKEKEKVIRNVLNINTPLIFLSSNFNDESLELVVKICDELKIPVSKSNLRLAEIHMKVNFFIIKELSDSAFKHGSLVIINGVGVMIIGKSGIGKSEALLELIEKGHSFVSDDTIILKKIGNNILGYSSPITKDFVESRGLGLIDIPLIYGLKSVKEFTNVNLVVELVSMEISNETDRLGNKELFYKIFDEKIPKIQIPVGNGRTLSVLIEAATNVYLIRQKGYDSLNIINERSKK